MREKTNAMRQLDRLRIDYDEHDYTDTDAVSGEDVAAVLGQDPAKVYKTLVTVGKSGAHYVFLVPVCEELDKKKAAVAADEKSVELVKSKELFGLTGYIHGGCSPIGMKKFFPTFIHCSASAFPLIIFSGGKIGYQIETSLTELEKVISYRLADLIKE